MKAEEILNDCQKFELGDNMPNIKKREIIQAMRTYARIQIEKDRSETKRLMNEKLKDFEGMNSDIEAIIDREITLDLPNQQYKVIKKTLFDCKKENNH
jgi:hypothetical protein